MVRSGISKSINLNKTQEWLEKVVTTAVLVVLVLFCQNCELSKKQIQEISCDQYFHLTGVKQGTHNDMSQWDNFVLLDHSINTAYNLETRTIQWQKSMYDIFAKTDADNGLNKPLVNGDEIIYASMFTPLYFAILDKNTGAVKKRIKVSDPDRSAKGQIVFYNNRIYFTGGRTPNYSAYYGNGLYYIDLSNLTYDSGDGYWAGEPVAVKLIERNSNPMQGVIQDGHYCYMAWYPVNNDVYDTDPGERKGVAKIDLDTGLTVWENNDYPSDVIFDITDTLLYVNYEDPLLSNLESGCNGIRAFNKETGIVEKVIKNAGLSCARISFLNGLMYFATGSYPDQFPYTALMYCIDEANGNIIWQRFKAETDEPSTLGCKPQVHNGVLYIPTSHYLELCDASTGEALGRDYSIYGDGWNAGDTVKWNNIMVVSDGKGQIWGIVMNWKIVNGKLVKE